MINQDLRDKIAELGYEKSLLYDEPSFDNSIIGIDYNGRIVYDYNKMAEEYVDDEGIQAINDYRSNLPEDTEMTDDEIKDELLMEAFEFIDYNTLRATPYMGNMAPIVVYDTNYMLDEEPDEPTYKNIISDEDEIVSFNVI